MPKMKNKSKKVIAPIKIKEEKSGNTELKELSYYVDDRVALMQQVFLTIKPKKLKSMVPDCLKNLDVDEIKELCLEEILGISTKRLKSIIQGTQCPSDTNSDSEVDEIIEHISLDEISSDDTATFVSDEEKKKKKPGNKEMTVLELVELQARARAIRSQLALEPVKKEIEDSVTENKSDEANNTRAPVRKEHVENDKIENSQPSLSIKPVRNYRSKNSTSVSPTLVNDINTDKTKSLVNDSTNGNNILVEDEEGEVKTSDSEKSYRSRSLRKKKRRHMKRDLSKDKRARQIEIKGSKSLKANVSFNEQHEKDEDEINLYVSDTEKQELLSDTRRPSHHSESDISIVDLNNSPLIISSENENDFKDEKEEGELDSPNLNIKKEKVDDDKKEIVQNKKQNEDSAQIKQKTSENSKHAHNDEDLQSDELSDYEALEENTDWKTRWINSDKVKKVLVTSKLCSNVKKKQKSLQTLKNDEILSNKSAAEKQKTVNVEITGSVEEFEKLTNSNQESTDTEIKDASRDSTSEQNET